MDSLVLQAWPWRRQARRWQHQDTLAVSLALTHHSQLGASAETTRRSEGPQPHLINIHFKKRQSICVRRAVSLRPRSGSLKCTGERAQLVSLYADEDSDDSYTPHKLSIRAGTHHGDLIEISSKELYKPRGWQDIWLSLTKEVDKSYE